MRSRDRDNGPEEEVGLTGTRAELEEEDLRWLEGLVSWLGPGLKIRSMGGSMWTLESVYFTIA
jgi:hypothetical protein